MNKLGKSLTISLLILLLSSIILLTFVTAQFTDFSKIMKRVIISRESESFFSKLKETITGKATQTTTVNITVIDSTAPTIDRVMNETVLVTLVENATYNLIINFTAIDTGGSGLNSTSAIANISKTGENATRYNNSCIQTSAVGSYANYSCTIQVWYFDIDGAWNIKAFIKDNASNGVTNATANITVSQLSAFVVGPTALSFASIASGATNTTASTNWVLNNTGNKDYTVGNIKVNATNLLGEVDSGVGLYAANFSVGNNTGATLTCEGTNSNGNGATNMSRSIFTAIVNSNLSRGNNSVNNNIIAQEQLYVCLNVAGSELTAQSYSTANQGAWTIQAV